MEGGCREGRGAVSAWLPLWHKLVINIPLSRFLLSVAPEVRCNFPRRAVIRRQFHIS